MLFAFPIFSEMQDKNHPLEPDASCAIPVYPISPVLIFRKVEGKNSGLSISDWIRTAIQNVPITSDVKNNLPEKLIVLNHKNMSICLVCVPLCNRPSMWWGFLTFFLHELQKGTRIKISIYLDSFLFSNWISLNSPIQVRMAAKKGRNSRI